MNKYELRYRCQPQLRYSFYTGNYSVYGVIDLQVDVYRKGKFIKEHKLFLIMKDNICIKVPKFDFNPFVLNYIANKSKEQYDIFITEKD